MNEESQEKLLYLKGSINAGWEIMKYSAHAMAIINTKSEGQQSFVEMGAWMVEFSLQLGTLKLAAEAIEAQDGSDEHIDRVVSKVMARAESLKGENLRLLQLADDIVEDVIRQTRNG